MRRLNFVHLKNMIVFYKIITSDKVKVKIKSLKGIEGNEIFFRYLKKNNKGQRLDGS